MQTWEMFIVALGLAMDAFSMSICKGLSVKKLQFKHAIIVGLYFGGFQALMPLLGYILGRQFESLITTVDHWLAFAFLTVIGINMIRNALSKSSEEQNSLFTFKAMLPLAMATSIDALAVGVTFAFLQVNILIAITFIGLVTFGLSAAGTKIGHVFGTKLKSKAELAGGIVLILMGLKILLEHLGVIG